MNQLEIKMRSGAVILIDYQENTLLTRTVSNPAGELVQVFQGSDYIFHLKKKDVLSTEKKKRGVIIGLPSKT